MDQLKYRPHIDGIRAIAVVSVLLFHLEYHFIPGGFVGVDVFFVISGYLITRLIYQDTQRGEFSFRRFYMRRIRRLAPALIATLVATFAVAVIFLTPQHFQRFSGALLSSVFSVSNFYFWAESGYFDASAELKPLLHTWSLSVEEQFYLLWPALIFFCRSLSARQLVWIFVALGFASLVAAKLMTAYAPSASFFLMPFRVYEFALGAGLAMLPVADRLRERYKEPLVLIGLLLIVISVVWFDKNTPFPDIYALVPCLGAACLLAGGTARFSGWLLRNPVSVFLGKISYSLYLVHWPIVVLYKHISFEDVVIGKTRIALLIMTLVAAVLLHRYIENRFRQPRSSQAVHRPVLRFAWLALPLVVGLSSLHAYATDGWRGRFDKSVIDAVGDVEAKQLIRRKFIDTPESLSNLPFDADWPVRILVMGDSHATDAFNALHLANPVTARISIRRLEIDDVCLYLFNDGAVSEEPVHVQRRCEVHFNQLKASPRLDDANHVVLSTRWDRRSFEHLPAFITYLESRNNKVTVMGRTAEFRNVPALVLKNGLGAETPKLLAAERDESLDKLNEQLKLLSEELGLGFIDKLPFLCDVQKQHCDVIDTDGRILYTDYGHWTLEGARLFGDRMWKGSHFKALLSEL